MSFPSNSRAPQGPAPRVLRWLSAALLASLALAACTTEVALGTGGGGTTTGDPLDDWTAPGFTDAGVPIICKPDSVWACYSGPPGTLGVGTCATGTRACNGDGTAFGPCTGDTAAVDQPCSSQSGLDCQGTAACGIDTLWSRGFHADQQSGATTISVDALGATLIAGYSLGTLDLGTGPLTFGEGGGGFLAAFDQAGKTLWSRSLAPTSKSAWGIGAVTREPGGNIYLTGSFSDDQSLDLGGGPLAGAGQLNAFIAKLDAQGNLLWARPYGDAGLELGENLGVDQAGEVVVTGTYVVGGDDPYAKAGGSGVFAARWSAAGQPLWSRRFGVWNVNEKSVSAIDPQGDVYLGGAFAGKTDFGGGPLEASSSETLYLAKLDAKGNHVWSKTLGGKGSTTLSALAFDGYGNLFLTGDYNGPAELGGGPLQPFFSEQTSARRAPYLAKLNSQGKHLWSRTLGSTAATSHGVALAVATTGDVTVAGTFNALDVGSYLGVDRMFLTRISAAGAPLWSHVYSGDESTHVDVAAMAVDPGGDLLVTGGYSGPGVVDLGAGPLPDPLGWQGMFLARIAP